MNEPWKYVPVRETKHKKLHIMIHSKISGRDKSTEIITRWVTTKELRETVGKGVMAKGFRVSSRLINMLWIPDNGDSNKTLLIY